MSYPNSSKTRDKDDGALDLVRKFTDYKRQVHKGVSQTSPTLTCPFCPSRPVQRDLDSLLLHVTEKHPEEGPQGRDVAAAEQYREKIWSLAVSPTGRRSKVDNVTKPHEDPAALNADSMSALPPASNESVPRLQYTSTLTNVKLQDFQRAQLQREDSISKSPAAASPNKLYKKRAIGVGPSPTSSVRTGHSTDDFHDGNSRPPTTGKRLYEPEAHLPSVGVVNAHSPKSRSTAQQQRKQHKAQQPGGQFHVQKLASSVEPGTLPISLLTTKSSSSQVIPSDQVAEPKIVLQPETRPISQEQLVAEVKGIYAGLVMVEGKCIQVDSKQAALAREAPEGTQLKLNNEQWQALIALHRTLLHEHHDFFLASQHPSATVAVRKLALKYAMPARLWRHGIHSFLELLRNRLPDSLDHMLAFIYLAYSMMTLLYETVPAFEETWIECLGDLGRYRMAIEDDDIRDREVWTQVARQWYLKASDRSPETGRLYHHLAILARPNALQQLFYYYKALSVPQPFIAARESILTLFDPFLNGKQTRRFPPVITAYVKVHAILFMRNTQESIDTNMTEFFDLLDGHIGRVTQKYLELGYYIAIANCLILVMFKSSDSEFQRDLAGAGDLPFMDSNKNKAASVTETASTPFVLNQARQLFVKTAKINLQRVGDPNVLSYLHITMIFLVHLSRIPEAMQLFQHVFPWQSLVTMLNALLRFYHTYSRIESNTQPVPEKNDFRPSPEEFASRGLFWTAGYFLPGWFRNKNIEDENQYKEDASMNTDYRPERILWLGCQLAKDGTWICYDCIEHKFFMPNHIEESLPTPSASMDIEPESGNESMTDTATLMAGSDGDVDEMSTTSYASPDFSKGAHEEEFALEVKQPPLHFSQQPRSVDIMETDESTSFAGMDDVKHSKMDFE